MAVYLRFWPLYGFVEIFQLGFHVVLTSGFLLANNLGVSMILLAFFLLIFADFLESYSVFDGPQCCIDHGRLLTHNLGI